MKILHVIPSVSPVYGGPSQAIRPMVSYLAKSGIEVDVATTTADGKKELNVSLKEPQMDCGAQYFYFPREHPRRWTFSPEMGHWLKRNADNYDLIHIHSLFSYPTFTACRAARNRKVPYLLRPLGTLSPWSIAYKAWRKKLYYGLIEHENLSAAAAIQATSHLEAQGIEQLGFGSKTHIIPLGINFQPPSHQKDFSIPPKILFLSRLHPTKALPVLLESLLILQREGIHLSLLIAGDGDPHYRRRLEKQVEELGLMKQVKFLAFVEGEAKIRVFNEADIFVLPSYQESFGIAVAEAMAAGLPVVVSDQVGIAPEIQEYGAGVVVPCSAASLAGGLKSIIMNPFLRQQMGKRGKELVQDKFSWEKVTPKLVSLYKMILDGKPSLERSRQ